MCLNSETYTINISAVTTNKSGRIKGDSITFRGVFENVLEVNGREFYAPERIEYTV